MTSKGTNTHNYFQPRSLAGARPELVRLILKAIGDLPAWQIEKRMRVRFTRRDLYELREGAEDGRFSFSRLVVMAEKLGVKIDITASLGPTPVENRPHVDRHELGRKVA
jgi:hypothetical protein